MRRRRLSGEHRFALRPARLLLNDFASGFQLVGRGKGLLDSGGPAVLTGPYWR
ncbi:MAG: hypothetical protein ACXVFN_00030 [Solirubrobacteraceae bacterium]